MKNQNPRVKEINISKTMRDSFLEYSMSVIVSRALPDVRDGMKPVHRRILYAMHDLGITAEKAYKKSARIVGEVIGKYHPHGDSAVYNTMVRMAQDFSYRYMLVDGHGNFGSVDGDGAAAMRYTEAKMSKISMELLRDINKNTIDYAPNYDGSEKEPVVLPSKFPNLLVNGSTGIAVGMATNIPPHNLGEVIDGVLALSKNPDITIAELMEYVNGPDFPTGAYILGKGGIRRAYETGRGSVMMRAKVEIEEKSNGKEVIIVTEIPYQVNKAKLVERIAELARDKVVEGISDLRDESDRKGMRIVIEVRRDANANILLNNLYKHTALQSNFSVNTLALVNGEPQTLNLKQCLHFYLEHQKEIITRRTKFDLEKAEARAHILEGLRIALDHIDEVISTIRNAATDEEAKNKLMEKFTLSERQAQAILDMRLRRLTGLERDKIEKEYDELLRLIDELKGVLADEEKVLVIIRDELLEIKERYGDERKSEIIIGNFEAIEDEDLVPEQSIIVTLTHNGYIKRLPVSTYRSQRRGGRGVVGMGTNKDDFVESLLTTSTHDTLLFFSNKGKVYRMKGYEIPEYSRTAKGLPIINLLEIEQGEWINAIIPISQFKDDEYLFFATKKGLTKRTQITEYANVRKSGLIAIGLEEDDEVISVRLTDGTKEIVMGTSKGQLIRFDETEVRSMGRTAKGVRGIKVGKDDQVIGMEVAVEGLYVLAVTKKGYGKRTLLEEYRSQTRGGKGSKTVNVTEKKGLLVALKSVSGEEDVLLVTTSGIIIRMDIAEIPITKRFAQGTRLMKVGSEGEVSTVAIAEKEEIVEEEGVSEEE